MINRGVCEVVLSENDAGVEQTTSQTRDSRGNFVQFSQIGANGDAVALRGSPNELESTKSRLGAASFADSSQQVGNPTNDILPEHSHTRPPFSRIQRKSSFTVFPHLPQPSDSRNGAKSGTPGFKRLNPGAVFGEMSMLMNYKRIANVRAATYVEMCVLQRSVSQNILARYEGDRSIVLTHIIQSCIEKNEIPFPWQQLCEDLTPAKFSRRNSTLVRNARDHSAVVAEATSALADHINVNAHGDSIEYGFHLVDHQRAIRYKRNPRFDRAATTDDLSDESAKPTLEMVTRQLETMKLPQDKLLERAEAAEQELASIEQMMTPFVQKGTTRSAHADRSRPRRLQLNPTKSLYSTAASSRVGGRPSSPAIIPANSSTFHSRVLFQDSQTVSILANDAVEAQETLQQSAHVGTTHLPVYDRALLPQSATGSADFGNRADEIMANSAFDVSAAHRDDVHALADRVSLFDQAVGGATGEKTRIKTGTSFNSLVEQYELQNHSQNGQRSILNDLVDPRVKNMTEHPPSTNLNSDSMSWRQNRLVGLPIRSSAQTSAAGGGGVRLPWRRRQSLSLPTTSLADLLLSKPEAPASLRRKKLKILFRHESTPT